MASCTPDEKGSEIHIGSSSTLAVSVFSLFLGPAAQAGQVTPPPPDSLGCLLSFCLALTSTPVIPDAIRGRNVMRRATSQLISPTEVARVSQ